MAAKSWCGLQLLSTVSGHFNETIKLSVSRRESVRLNNPEYQLIACTQHRLQSKDLNRRLISIVSGAALIDVIIEVGCRVIGIRKLFCNFVAKFADSQSRGLEIMQLDTAWRFIPNFKLGRRQIQGSEFFLRKLTL